MESDYVLHVRDVIYEPLYTKRKKIPDHPVIHVSILQPNENLSLLTLMNDILIKLRNKTQAQFTKIISTSLAKYPVTHP